MKTAPIAVLVAAVLLGSASAGVTTYLLLVPGSASSREVAAPVLGTPGAGSDAELLERIEALAEENRALRRRVETLELRPALVPRAPVEGFVSEEAFEAFRKEFRASLAGRNGPSSEPEELKGQVADALIEIRREEAVSAVRDYQEKRAARLEEDLTRLSDWLALEAYQVDEMRALLLAQYEREEEQRRLWEAGIDRESLAETKRSDGERFRSDLERTLTPEQLEPFWTKISGGGKD